MDKKRILMGAAAILVSATFIGGSLAYFQADGRDVRQQINTKKLSIDLIDMDSKEKPDSLIIENAVPGYAVDFENGLKKYAVVNTGDTKLYARVTIQKYFGTWEQNEFQKEYDKDAGKISLGFQEPWFEMASEEENETMYLYYRKPLEPGEATESLLKEIKISEELTNEYADKGIEMDFLVDGVQFFAADSAILSEWGVEPVFDNDGNIVEIIE